LPSFEGWKTGAVIGSRDENRLVDAIYRIALSTMKVVSCALNVSGGRKIRSRAPIPMGAGIGIELKYFLMKPICGGYGRARSVRVSSSKQQQAPRRSMRVSIPF
jgi:hypothetical protein